MKKQLKDLGSALWLGFWLCVAASVFGLGSSGCGGPLIYGEHGIDETGGVTGSHHGSEYSVAGGAIQSGHVNSSGGQAAADHCVDQILRVEAARHGQVTVANPTGECYNFVGHGMPQSQGFYPYMYGYGAYGYGGVPPYVFQNGQYLSPTGGPVRW